MVHCFCVCSSSTLLGDLGRVSRSVQYDFLCVLSKGFFFNELFVSSLIRDILASLSLLCILIICSCVLAVLVYLSILAR